MPRRTAGSWLHHHYHLRQCCLPRHAMDSPHCGAFTLSAFPPWLLKARKPRFSGVGGLAWVAVLYAACSAAHAPSAFPSLAVEGRGARGAWVSAWTALLHGACSAAHAPSAFPPWLLRAGKPRSRGVWVSAWGALHAPLHRCIVVLTCVSAGGTGFHLPAREGRPGVRVWRPSLPTCWLSMLTRTHCEKPSVLGTRGVAKYQ